MNGNFTRVSPAKFAEKIGIPQGWFVISHRWMPDKKARRLSHGKWFKIESANGYVFRILRFSVNLEGTPATETGQIVLDWPAWLELWDYAEDVSNELELTISKVSWWQYPRMALAHPDPTHKLAGALGLLSVVLGLLSIVISFAFAHWDAPDVASLM
jgi:hypothetical protein